MSNGTGASDEAFSGASAADLAAWLEGHGVPTAAYGTGLAKTVDDLYEEVVLRESVLTLQASGRPLRCLNVLNLYITNDAGQVLVEAAQVLPDGRTRQRGLVLSEKLVGNESWREAALRGVSEELGSCLPGPPQVVLEEQTYHLVVQEFTSNSYPGLETRYMCHRVYGTVAGLPQQAFQTVEERPGGQLVSCWEWKDLELLAPALRSLG